LGILKVSFGDIEKCAFELLDFEFGSNNGIDDISPKVESWIPSIAVLF